MKSPKLLKTIKEKNEPSINQKKQKKKVKGTKTPQKNAKASIDHHIESLMDASNFIAPKPETRFFAKFYETNPQLTKNKTAEKQERKKSNYKSNEKSIARNSFMPWTTEGKKGSWMIRTQKKSKSRKSSAATTRVSAAQKVALEKKKLEEEIHKKKKVPNQAYYLKNFQVRNHPNFKIKRNHHRTKTSTKSLAKGSFLQIEEEMYIQVPNKEKKFSKTGEKFFKRKRHSYHSDHDVLDSRRQNDSSLQAVIGYKRIKETFNKNLEQNRQKYQSSEVNARSIMMSPKVKKMSKDFEKNVDLSMKVPLLKKTSSELFRVYKTDYKNKFVPGYIKTTTHQKFEECKVLNLTSQFSNKMQILEDKKKRARKKQLFYSSSASRRELLLDQSQEEKKLKKLFSGSEQLEKEVFKNADNLLIREKEKLTKIHQNRLFYNLTYNKFRQNSKNPFFMGPIKRLLIQYGDISHQLNKRNKKYSFDRNDVYMKRVFLETNFKAKKRIIPSHGRRPKKKMMNNSSLNSENLEYFAKGDEKLSRVFSSQKSKQKRRNLSMSYKDVSKN